MPRTSLPHQTEARGAAQRMLDALLDMVDRGGQGRPDWVDRAQEILERAAGGGLVDDRGDDDSDRPPWAGGNPDQNPHGGGGGGKPDDAGVGKGELYADQYIVFRDLDPLGGGGDGEPVLDMNGQPILVGTDGTSVFPVYLEQTEDGDWEIPADMLAAVQEVELGRANLARAPEQVLAAALDEALGKINSGSEVTTDAAGRIVVDGVAIDSPRENLALYQYLMTSGGARSWPEVTQSWPDVFKGLLGPDLTTPDWDPASLLGAAFNKEDSVSMDAMLTINSILGVNIVTGLPDTPEVEYFSFHGEDEVTGDAFETYDYDRAARYGGITLQWYEDTDDDPTDLELVTGSVLSAVFDTPDWEDEYLDIGDYPGAFGTASVDEAGVNDFAQAVEDARKVISFVHDNDAIVVSPEPEEPAPSLEAAATLSAFAPATAEEAAPSGEAGGDEDTHDHEDGEDHGGGRGGHEDEDGGDDHDDHDDHDGGHGGAMTQAVGSARDDVVETGGGRQHLIGGRGDDALSGGGGADVLGAGPGDDLVMGGAGRDLLVGGEGDDIMVGDRGPDKLFGQDGDDVLIGGKGCDTLRGGEGADRFVYLEAGDANRKGHGDHEEPHEDSLDDTLEDDGEHGGGEEGSHGGRCRHDAESRLELIVDFEVGTDVIDFSLVETLNFFADGPTAYSVWAVEEGQHTRLLADTDGDVSGPDGADMSIKVLWVTPEDLGASDFLF